MISLFHSEMVSLRCVRTGAARHSQRRRRDPEPRRHRRAALVALERRAASRLLEVLGQPRGVGRVLLLALLALVAYEPLAVQRVQPRKVVVHVAWLAAHGVIFNRPLVLFFSSGGSGREGGFLSWTKASNWRAQTAQTAGTVSDGRAAFFTDSVNNQLVKNRALVEIDSFQNEAL